jgi:hypothetical protein
MTAHHFLGPTAACLAALLVLSCTNDYNPFTDPSRALAVVKYKSFHDADTLNIFTTETLVVAVADRGLIDSFSIVAPTNRRSPDTFVVKRTPGQPVAAGPYTYLVSLTDTGWKTLTINTFRSNGERVPQEFSLYLRNPLHQNTIYGFYGDTVSLAAAPHVRDADVAYHWDFGGGYDIASPLPQISAAVKMQSFSSAGLLWVSDPSGAHPSPAVPFTYNLKDTTGPFIKCVNDGYVGKDTIVTGDTTFYFKVQIWDPTQAGSVQSASVNGHKFDINDDPLYICVLTHMDTNVRLFPVTVSAVNNPQFLVSSTKTFWLQFSSTMSHGGGVLFTVTDPSTDTSVTESRNKVIFGYVEDYVHDSISVIVKLWENNAQNSLADTVHVMGKATWSFNFPLANGSNRARLAAYASNGDSLAGTSLFIVCDTTMKDTTPPVIIDVTANGAPAANKFVTDSTAVLRIIAYDEGSGIDSLCVNKRPLVQSAGGYGFIWLDTVTVLHRPEGSAFTILAVDNAMNRDTVSIVLCQNRPPQILRAPPANDTIPFDSRLVDTIIWVDADNDQVQAQKAKGPDSMNVVSFGQILQLSWTPQLPADTGLKKIRINLWDGYQTTTDSFQLFVTAAGSLPPAVQIDTAAMAVPAYLEANMDSLVLNVKTKNDSGNTPLSFYVSLNGASLPVTGRLCVWHPGINDVGRQVFTVTVIDTFHRSVAAQFAVTVEPPNRPCTLQVRYTIPVTADGELDLSNATQPETLFFSVKDPDIPAVEHHTVVVRFAAGQTEFVLDSTRQFFVTLPAKSSNGQAKDTLCVSVTDRDGHADSLRFDITYAGAGNPGFTGRIVINTTSSGASITGSVIDFPLLVRLDKSYFTFSQAAPQGQDIRFSKSSGASLPYEIEYWDNVAGDAEIWVKVDTVYALNDSQYIRMTWGNPAAADSSNGRAVFDTAAGYMGVWHMNDGSATQNANSAQAQFNATPTGGGANPSIGYGSGVIAEADSLSGDRYLSAGLLPTVQQISMSAWVNPTVRAPWAKVICKSWGNYNGPYQVFSLEVSGPKDSAIQFHVGLTNQFSAYAVSNDSLLGRTWTHLAGTYDGSFIRLYVNGALAGEYSWVNGPVPPVPSVPVPWTIGGWGQQAGESFTGKIDEARIYRGVWSPDYLKLSYENQRPGSAVLQFK